MPERGAALFDIDGTLIDSNELHVIAWQEAFAGAGHPVAPDAIRGQIGKGGDKLVPALLPEADDALAKAISGQHGEIFRGRFLARAQPFPKAADLLARTHQAGWRVVLASSAEQAEVDHYVALLGVRDLVAATTSLDDVDASKPAPDIFATALKKAGASTGLAIGDSPFDVRAAAEAGVPTLALLSGGFGRRVLEEAGALAIYADVAELLVRFEHSPLNGR